MRYSNFPITVYAFHGCDESVAEAANTVCDTELLVSFSEAADMEAGITPRQDFASVEELFADCSH